MVKPKPSEPMRRVSFTLEDSVKNAWQNHAKALQMPLAQLIKEAMNDKLYRATQFENKQNQELHEFKQIFLEGMLSMREEMSELSQAYLTPPQNIPENLPETTLISQRILTLLGEYQSLTRADIDTKYATFYGPITPGVLRKILGTLRTDGVIEWDQKTQQWSCV